jgi:hypothetical protein
MTAPTTAPPPAPAVTRFGQLTFTSVDGLGRPGGGWQVMDSQGVTPEEGQALVRRVDALFRWPTEIPDFPTAAQREQLPHRLVYAQAGPGTTAYWHTVPAGKDGSGRPGNVFAHIVLDRAPDDETVPLRPADLVLSHGWLRPFGPDEVRKAVLPPLAPQAGAATDKLGEVDRLRAIAERGALLQVLLDAVRAALDGGAPVALGLSRPADALSWIAAVGRLMSPGRARGLTWSTLERAATLARAGVHLAVVPLADLGQVPAGSVVALAEDEQPVLGDRNQPHRDLNGAPVAVTPWSDLADVVLGDEDRELAHRVLRAQDEVAAVVGDRDLDPGWPLAVAMTAQEREVHDAAEEARQFAEDKMPAGRSTAVLRRVMQRVLVGRLGRTAADAWTGLARLTEHDSAPLRAMAVGEYLDRALRDDDWLLGPRGVSVPAVTEGRYVPDDELRRSAHETLQRRASVAVAPGADPVRFAAAALRAVALMDDVDLLRNTAEAPRIGIEAYSLLDVSLPGPALDPTLGPQLVAAAGPVSGRILTEFAMPIVRDLARRSPKPPGQRVPPAVLAWLYPEPPAPQTVESLAREPDPLLAEIAAQATAIVSDPSTLRLSALWAELATDQPSPERLARLAAAPPLPPRELSAVVARFGPQPVPAFLLPALLQSAMGEDLQALVREVLDPRHDLLAIARQNVVADGALTAARMRDLAVTWTYGDDATRPAAARQLLAWADQLLTTFPRWRLAPDLQGPLTAAHVVEVILRSGPARPTTPSALEELIATAGRSGRVPWEAAEILWALLERRVLTDRAVVHAALLAASGPLPGTGVAALHALRELTVPGEDAPEPLLDAVVRSRVRTRRFSVDDLRDQLGRRVHDEIETAEPERSRARQWCDHFDAFADAWWTRVTPQAAEKWS